MTRERTRPTSAWKAVLGHVERDIAPKCGADVSGHAERRAAAVSASRRQRLQAGRAGRSAARYARADRARSAPGSSAAHSIAPGRIDSSHARSTVGHLGSGARPRAHARRSRRRRDREVRDEPHDVALARGATEDVREDRARERMRGDVEHLGADGVERGIAAAQDDRASARRSRRTSLERRGETRSLPPSEPKSAGSHELGGTTAASRLERGSSLGERDEHAVMGDAASRARASSAGARSDGRRSRSSA